MATSVAAVQNELVARLTDAFEDDVYVRYEFPLEEPQQYEGAYVLEPDPTDYTRQRESQLTVERYVVRVLIVAYRPGDDAEAARDRRWEMVDTLEEALGDDDFLGGTADDAGIQAITPSLVGYQNGYRATALVSLAVLVRF